MLYVIETDMVDGTLGRMWECETQDEAADVVVQAMFNNRNGGPMATAMVDEVRKNIIEFDHYKDSSRDLRYQVGMTEN
jgi:hypothetical protein